MRRFFLPVLVCTFWLASLAGAGWMRAECIQACMVKAEAQVAQMGELPACCAKQAAASGRHVRRAECTPANCPKCQARAKALHDLLPTLADAPLFLDAACGVPQPVVVRSSAPMPVPSRAWQWSLPPPDTLLNLHCQLLI